jgi:hypothetical protein
MTNADVSMLYMMYAGNVGMLIMHKRSDGHEVEWTMHNKGAGAEAESAAHSGGGGSLCLSLSSGLAEQFRLLDRSLT